MPHARAPLATLLPLLAAIAMPADGAPVIAASADGTHPRLHVGTLEKNAPQPTYNLVLTRSSEGWSDAVLLPSPRSGVPMVLRGLTWFAERRVDRNGTSHHQLMPVTGEAGTMGVRIEHVQGATSVALEGIDDWTFFVAELVPPGHVFVREIQSHGTALEMEVSREAAWQGAWPQGTTLLATGPWGSMMVVIGAGPDAAMVLMHGGSAQPTALPALPLGGRAPSAACVTAAGPVVIAARSGDAGAPDGVTAWTWNSSAWSEGAALTLPRGGRPVALAVTALGQDRRDALAVALLDGPERVLLSWTLSEGAWGEPERQVLAAQPAADGALRPAALSPARAGGDARPALAEAERRAMRLRWLRWALVIAAFPVLVLLLRHLARMR